MNRYIEFRKGLAGSNGKCGNIISLEDLHQYVDPSEDCYRSLFIHDETLLEYAKKNGSVSGFRGKAGIDRLVFDLDHKDLEEARKDTITLINKLQNEFNVQLDEIGVFFSGRKGFAVELKTEGIKGIGGVFSENLPFIVKRFCKAIAGELSSFDRVIYNLNRIYRINGTLHQVESEVDGKFINLFKTSLPVKMLFNSSVVDIKRYAIELQPTQEYPPVRDTSKLSALAETIISDVENLSNKTRPTCSILDSKGLPDASLCPKGQKVCIWRLSQGAYTQNRDNALLILAVHEKKLGMPKEVIRGKLEGVLSLMNQHDPEKADIDPVTDSDLDRIVNQAFTHDYDFGCNNEILSEVCGPHCHLTRNKVRDGATMSIIDSYRRSKPFFREYYGNIVATGIKSVDAEMPLFLGTFNLLVGSPGCHAKGTEVIMYDGTLKKVEDVRVGDKLMGPDSQPRTVLELCRGSQEMVRIVPNKGESFIVNLDHILSLKYSGFSNNAPIRHILNVSVRDYLTQTECYKKRFKLYRTGVDFPKKDLEIDPYILGVWLGDGSSSSNRIWNMDKEIIQSMKNYSETNGLELRIVESMSKNSGKAKCYAIASKTSKRDTNQFLASLRDLSLLNNKHIPLKYLTSSREDRLNLLAGIIDTDGHKSIPGSTNKANNKAYMINKYASCYEITQKSDTLADDIVFLARSLGFSAYKKRTYKSAKYKNGSLSPKRPYNRICIGGKLHLIPVKVSRKKVSIQNSRKSVLHIGFKIEHLPKDNYYGFCLNRDHLYLLRDFTVTHNTGKTSLMLNILRNASRSGIDTLFFSQDMSEEMLIQRFAPILLTDSQGRPRMSGKEFMMLHARNDQKLMEEAEEAFMSLSDAININYNTNIWVDDIRNEIKAHEASFGKKPKLVIVDYVQLLGSDKDGYARHTDNAIKITNLAKETGVCILGLSQTPRGCKDDEAKAKGSGAWEEKASTQLNCWRPFRFTHLEHDWVMSLRMVKNRIGPSGTVDLFWHGPSGLLRDLREEEEMELVALREHLDHDD